MLLKISVTKHQCEEILLKCRLMSPGKYIWLKSVCHWTGARKTESIWTNKKKKLVKLWITNHTPVWRQCGVRKWFWAVSSTHGDVYDPAILHAVYVSETERYDRGSRESYVIKTEHEDFGCIFKELAFWKHFVSEKTGLSPTGWRNLKKQKELKMEDFLFEIRRKPGHECRRKILI